MLRSASFLLLALLVPLILIPACKPKDKVPLEKKSIKGDGKAPSKTPEIREIVLPPFLGSATLDLDIPVKDTAGRSRPLSEILASRNLIVMFGGDTEDKQEKAATRAMRDIAKSGKAGGFKVLVVLPSGTDPKTALEFVKKRQLDPSTVALVDEKGELGEKMGWPPRTAALVDNKGTVALRWNTTEGFDARLGFEPGLTTDLLIAAWAPPDTTPSLPTETKNAMVDVVRKSLRGAWIGDAVPTDVQGAAGMAVVREEAAHGVWVTIYRRGETKGRRGYAEGKLGDAAGQAAHKALVEAGSAWASDVANLRFSIDVPGEATVVPVRHLRSLWYVFEPGVDGVIVRREGKDGVVLPQEPVTEGTLSPRVRGRDQSLKKTFELACHRVEGKATCWNEEGTELLRFRTQSFGVAEPDGPSTDFYRGGSLWHEGPITEAEILESIRIGGQWLLGTVKPDGKFDYEYHPNLDRGSNDYNIVRHAGSVYGLFEMYELAGQEPALAGDREGYIDGGARAMGYVLEGLKTPPEAKQKDRICLMEKGRCESGSAALSLMTFVSRPAKEEIPQKYRDRIYPPGDSKLVEGLALTLTDMIDDKGRLYQYYRDAIAAKGVKKEPEYYPGETMLALIRLHQQSKDPRWLEAAKKIGDWQVSLYEKDRFTFPDHWVMQALYRLWQVTKEDRYATTGYAMATHSAAEQYPFLWTPYPDYLGSWRRNDDIPRTTRAASRMEAIRGVVELAWEHGGAEPTLWEDSLLHAARHLAEQQFRPENSWWQANPKKSVGAYKMGIVDNHCRIDNNQHGLVGMVGALEVIRHRAGRPLRTNPGPVKLK